MTDKADIVAELTEGWSGSPSKRLQPSTDSSPRSSHSPHASVHGVSRVCEASTRLRASLVAAEEGEAQLRAELARLRAELAECRDEKTALERQLRVAARLASDEFAQARIAEPRRALATEAPDALHVHKAPCVDDACVDDASRRASEMRALAPAVAACVAAVAVASAVAYARRRA